MDFDSLTFSLHQNILHIPPPITSTTISLLLLTFCFVSKGLAFQPAFTEPIVNLTLAVGREATFRCFVHHLGGYRVGWVKADTKAIQAIHDHVITHNPRISVSHNDHTTWNLHIRNIQEEDEGQYMCQINTDPMLSQLGTLDVVVPPDFIPGETSGDLMVAEGGLVKITCKATGQPPPTIRWRREDNADIIVRDIENNLRTRVHFYDGETLQLPKISRSEMGAYMCIATNGVPPTVSKRLTIHVHFHPVIRVPNQLVGAPLGTDVTLECIVEASPRSINYWMKGTGGMVIASNKYDVQFISKNIFEVQMLVVVRNLQKSDMGSYRCLAKNSIGEVESNIRLYEIPGPTGLSNRPFDEEDYDEQFGSAEREHDEDFSNNVIERGRRPSIQMSLAPPKASSGTISENYIPVDLLSRCSKIGNVNLFITILCLLVYYLYDI